jgi:acyl dehydratase
VAISPDTPSVAKLEGFDLGSRACSYTERDAILFALAVGARPEELRWVYERSLQVMPTFATTLGLWAVRAAGGIGVYDPVTTLHIGQALALRRSLPPVAEFELHGRVDSVLDKGSAALIDVVVSCDYFDTTYTIFIPGAGGFGGERGSRAPRTEHSEEPERTAVVQTWPGQAALYRLTGDLHPVHIDPQVAAANGFQRPILHGLCTLAAVMKALSDASSSDLVELRTLTCRLTAPVLPGDAIDVAIWDLDDAHPFIARVGESIVLDGSAAFGDG